MRAKARWPQASPSDRGFMDFSFGFCGFGATGSCRVHFEDMHMMGQAVQNGAREAFRAEDLGPFIERQVGGLGFIPGNAGTCRDLG